MIQDFTFQQADMGVVGDQENMISQGIISVTEAELDIRFSNMIPLNADIYEITFRFSSFSHKAVSIGVSNFEN